MDKNTGPRETSTPSHPLTDPTTSMNAIIWHSKKDVRYVKKPKPCLTDPRDVIIKVTATSICGSDLHLYSNATKGMKDGDILGHEFMGIVEDVGNDVKKISKGARVVVAFDIACGFCEFCKREEYTACDTTNPSKMMQEMYGHQSAALFGYSHLTGGIPGGQAEYVRVPFADINCLPLPDDIPDQKALYLSDIIPTAYHGTEMANVKEGSTVAIWGLGPVGLLVARWCQIRKAGSIIGIECEPDRIKLARDHLGITVINFKEKDVCKTLLEIFPTGVDCSIECAGFEYASSLLHKVERAIGLESDTADIFQQMFFCTRKFGNVSILGVYIGYANHFPVGMMMEKGLKVQGSQSPTQKYWKMNMEKVRSGEFDPSFVVTTQGKLSDAPELYKKFSNKDEVVKVFLRP